MTTNNADINIISGDTRILLIAPHGFMGDDDRTDIIVFEACRRLKCCAIVNNVFKREEINFNSIASASRHPGFFKAIKRVTDTPGHTLVVWIHGGGVEGTKWPRAVAAGGFDCAPKDICAFIGYGQGHNPKKKKEEPNARYTGTVETAKAFQEHLTDAGMIVVITGDTSPEYKAREPDNSNQWFVDQYPFEQVESMQIEIRKEGYRDDERNAKRTGRIIADVLTRMLGSRKNGQPAPSGAMIS